MKGGVLVLASYSDAGPQAQENLRPEPAMLLPLFEGMT